MNYKVLSTWEKLGYRNLTDAVQRIRKAPGKLLDDPTAGHARVPLVDELIVDCDVPPRIPSVMRLKGHGTEHRKMGKIKLEKRRGKLLANGVEVIRYFSLNQKDGNRIQGNALRVELQGKQVLNACILDALLSNRELIPESWRNVPS